MGERRRTERDRRPVQCIHRILAGEDAARGVDDVGRLEVAVHERRVAFFFQLGALRVCGGLPLSLFGAFCLGARECEHESGRVCYDVLAQATFDFFEARGIAFGWIFFFLVLVLLFG